MASLISKLLDLVQQKAQKVAEEELQLWIELVIHVAEDRPGLSPEALIEKLAQCGKTTEDLAAAVETYNARRALIAQTLELERGLVPYQQLCARRDTLAAAKQNAVKEFDVKLSQVEEEIRQLRIRQSSINQNRESLRRNCGSELAANRAGVSQRISQLEAQLQTQRYHLEHPAGVNVGNKALIAELEGELDEQRKICDHLDDRINDPAAFLR